MAKKLKKKKPTRNVFCPKGKGGGVDPSCSKGGTSPKGAGAAPKGAKAKVTKGVGSKGKEAGAALAKGVSSSGKSKRQEPDPNAKPVEDTTPAVGPMKDKVTPPTAGQGYSPDVNEVNPSTGCTRAARVGVDAMSVPPPPGIGRLPNLTEHERKVESEFADAFEKDPEGMADAFLDTVRSATKPGEAPIFGTDDAKVLHNAWDGQGLTQDQRAENRATLNLALHQTANAIAKKAFLKHLDTLSPGDEVLVTAGGCHEAGELLMMSDGSLKMVEDITEDDFLMGPDSKPRKVEHLVRGFGPMFRIIPKKGKSFIVNGSHTLALEQRKRFHGDKSKDKISRIEVSVNEYLTQKKGFKDNCFLYRVPVDYDYQPVPMDPYFLGVWLGDGTHSLPQVTVIDPEIAEYMEEFVSRFDEVELVIKDKDSHDGIHPNKSKDYKIALINKRGGPNLLNPVMELLKEAKVFKNKHIPDCYKYNDRDTRLRLLAGLIDTDGSSSNTGIEFSSKSERTAYDVAYIARSLGYSAYVSSRFVKSKFIDEAREYWRVSITGDFSDLPLKVKRKIPKKHSHRRHSLRVGFTIEPAGRDRFYGFVLDQDHLYLMSDFTVTHNCGSGKGFGLKNVPEAKALKAQSKAVFDSAGDQNATENPWIQQELEKRGLKGNYVYMHADPYTQWADPEMGVVKRAKNPEDGRMVDAHVYADSYALGAKNHQAFYDKHKNNPNAKFVFMKAGPMETLPDGSIKRSLPVVTDSIPKEAFVNSDHLRLYSRKIISDQQDSLPERIVRGSTMGERVWATKKKPTTNLESACQAQELLVFLED